MQIEEKINLLTLDVRCLNPMNNYDFIDKLKSIITGLLENTTYKIIRWNNTSEYISIFIKDDYTNRLMSLFICNISLDKFAWRDHILLRTASDIEHYDGKPYFYTKLSNLVKSLDNLNIIYNYSGSFGS